MKLEDLSTSFSAPILKRLNELKDVRLGLPISSHRKAPIGPLMVATKKSFRLLFQPVINELFRKQAQFNDELLGWAHAMYRDLKSLESATVAVRSSMDVRVRKLEEQLAVMQKQLGHPGEESARAERNGAERNGSPQKN